jgi:5-methylcytosine-specific restriction endonuclease McrA
MIDITSARAARYERMRELRVLGWTHQEIGDEVGCTKSMVGYVLRGTEAELEGRRVRSARSQEQRLEKRRANADRKAAYDREYRAANAERMRQYQLDYREANPGRKEEQARRYRQENRERLLADKRQRWTENADKLNARRRASYSDADRERLRRYRHDNIEAHRAIVARRKMRSRTGMDALDRLLSIEYRKAIGNDSCAYCGGEGEHDDHKLPLARGGTDHWWNLHRTCVKCNQRKHTMTHEEFLASGRVSLATAS